MFIGICSRSQVSVYRTIGPLVFIFAPKHRLWVIYVLSKNKKNIKHFLMKCSFFFSAEKILCMMHGQVFVMETDFCFLQFKWHYEKTRFDTNMAVHLQNMAISLQLEKEGFNYPLL